jgi:hypothetical protein
VTINVSRRSPPEQQIYVKGFCKLLRQIFGPKRKEIIGGWKLQNEELCNLYSDKMKVDEMGRTCSMHGED